MPGSYSTIPIINRMTKILDYIVSHPSDVTATILLQELQIPKTTLYRLLSSMLQNGYLGFRSESNTYVIGNIFQKTYATLDDRVHFIKKVSTPFLEELSAKVQETVKLNILSGMQSYTVATIESNKPIRISIHMGATFPLYTGAAGKILLSSFSDNEIAQYYQQYGKKKYTKKTISTPEAMIEELRTIRAQHYAIDRGEFIEEIHAAACAIRDSNNQIVAAISIAYPSSAYEEEPIEHFVQSLLAAAEKINHALEKTKLPYEIPARLVKTHPEE